MTDNNESLLQQASEGEPLVASDSSPLTLGVPPSEYHKILNGAVVRKKTDEKKELEGDVKGNPDMETDDRFVGVFLSFSFSPRRSRPVDLFDRGSYICRTSKRSLTDLRRLFGDFCLQQRLSLRLLARRRASRVGQLPHERGSLFDRA